MDFQTRQQWPVSGPDSFFQQTSRERTFLVQRDFFALASPSSPGLPDRQQEQTRLPISQREFLLEQARQARQAQQTQQAHSHGQHHHPRHFPQHQQTQSQARRQEQPRPTSSGQPQPQPPNPPQAPVPTPTEQPRPAERSAPLETADMTINMSCKICMEQTIDTLSLPCAHLAMCQWCADTMQQMDTVVKCPVCRTSVQNFQKIFIAS